MDTEASIWCTGALSEFDAIEMRQIFHHEQIRSISDILALSEQNLRELKLSLGLRNRLWVAIQQLRRQQGQQGGGDNVPVIPLGSIPACQVCTGRHDQVVLPNQPWVCRHCTVINNPADRPVSPIPLRPSPIRPVHPPVDPFPLPAPIRQPNEPEVPKAMAPWACTNCTYINKGTMLCAMCTSKRPRTPPLFEPGMGGPGMGGPGQVDPGQAEPGNAGGQRNANRKARPENEVEFLRKVLAPSPGWSPPAGADPNTCLRCHVFMQAFECVVRKRMNLPKVQLPKEWLLKVSPSVLRECYTRVRAAQEVWRTVGVVVEQETTRLRNALCEGGCGRPGSAIFLKDLPCSHTVCIHCTRNYLLALLDQKKCTNVRCVVKGCNGELPRTIVTECLRQDQLVRFDQLAFDQAMGEEGSKVECPRCGLQALLALPPDPTIFLSKAHPITETDANGQPIAPEAWIHFNVYRMRCRGCEVVFCTSCLRVPYHVGFTCEGFKSNAEAVKCRYCDKPLSNQIQRQMSARDIPCCDQQECRDKLDQACRQVLNCGHSCWGIRGEGLEGGKAPGQQEVKQGQQGGQGEGAQDQDQHVQLAQHAEHFPCLHPACKREGDKVQATDLCNICWVEEIGQAPTIMLGCGHAFHYGCVLRKLQQRWPGRRVTFGFMDCPLCKVEIAHPLLKEQMQDMVTLKRSIAQRALDRLRIDHLDTDRRLSDPASRYFKQPGAFAMDSFAYYECFKCKKHFFGGKRECEQNQDAENRPPEEFVCYACGDLRHIQCKLPSHDEYLMWKCRYCCSPAVWFCFGHTHFCDKCHTTLTYAVKPCPGPGKCPLQVAHPPNGADAKSEFALGCGLCLDNRKQQQLEQQAGS